MPHRLLTDSTRIPQPADVPWLLARGLGGVMAGRLPAGDPTRAQLEHQGLSLLARHLQIRTEVQELLGLWARHGIPALLIKGFALAEFWHKNAGHRFYSDIDIISAPDVHTVQRAVALAQSLGWAVDTLPFTPERWTHETAHLTSPLGHRIDLHRFCVSGLPTREAATLTQKLWRVARPTDWNGTPLYTLPPAYALALLAIHRGWGGDAGQLKPADWLDADVLRLHTSTQEIEKAVQRLGAAHAWQAFAAALARGYKQREAPNAALSEARLRDGLPPYPASVWKARCRSWPATVKRVPALLPDIWAAHRVYAAGGDPRAALAQWPLGRRRPSHRQTADVIMDASRIAKALYPKQAREGICLPRALLTFRILRRLGLPVVFVSGVAKRVGGSITGHAWVEQEGEQPLWDYGEPDNRLRFSELLRYPPE